jgi:hypothetical protein
MLKEQDFFPVILITVCLALAVTLVRVLFK